MTKEFDDIRVRTATAIRDAVDELRIDGAKLIGFAICTDDDVMTLFHIACTPDWVQENEESYEDIGFIYTEWKHSASDAAFNPIGKQLAALASQPYPSNDDWAAARDRRFDLLVQALRECRDAGIFDSDTLLCVGSTDPSDHLEALAMNSVDLLNSPAIADKFAKALGYEKYRHKT